MDDSALIECLSEAGYKAATLIRSRLRNSLLSRHSIPDAEFRPLSEIKRMYQTRLNGLSKKETPYAKQLANEIENLLNNLAATIDTEIEIVSFFSELEKDGFLVFVGHPSREILGCCYVTEGGGQPVT